MFISFNFENVYDDDDVPPEGLKANSGRLEGEDVDQAVLELVHLKIVYFHIFIINIVNINIMFRHNPINSSHNSGLIFMNV